MHCTVLYCRDSALYTCLSLTAPNCDKKTWNLFQSSFFTASLCDQLLEYKEKNNTPTSGFSSSITALLLSIVASDLYSGTRVRNLACQKPRPRLSRLIAGNLRNDGHQELHFQGTLLHFPHFNPELINIENPRCSSVATEINLISSASESSTSLFTASSIAVLWGRKEGYTSWRPLATNNASRKGRSDTACSALRLESPRKGRASRKPQQWAQRSLETSMYESIQRVYGLDRP